MLPVRDIKAEYLGAINFEALNCQTWHACNKGRLKFRVETV